MNFKVIAKGASSLAVKRYMGLFWFRRSWLNKTQWLPKEQLEQIQLECLRKLLVHSYKTVPFYHNLMDQYHFNPEIKDIREIEKLPILTKKDILEAGEKILSSKYPKFTNSIGHTGGTTGTPLRIHRNFSSIETEHAFVRRQWDWAGLSFKDRTAFLSARRIISPEQETGKLYAYDPFMKELILSNYHLCPTNVRQFAEAIVKYKVSSIAGYPSSIFYFAQVCEDLGCQIKLKAVLTSSETLMDYMRSTIAKVFDCKVFDFYGSAERVCYIFTCEHGNYHILPEYGLTELIPQSDQTAGTYKIIGTGFWNWATPLIRYDTGDVVELSDNSCACGRNFQTVKRINGRTGTFIQTPSGKKYAPTLMSRVSRMSHNIVQVQIIQDRLDHILVTYIPNSKFTQDDLKEFQKNMRDYLPSELSIEFRKTDSVIKTESGKTNLIVSQL